MKDELAPVTPDESLIRLVWKFAYKANRPDPAIVDAFRPKPDETDGISVFRASCLNRPEQALDAMAAENRDRYAIVSLPVADILALGLTVVPVNIDEVLGHAVIPELNITDYQADRNRLKKVQTQLAKIASRNVIRPPQ